jgi:hypothetical protein
MERNSCVMSTGAELHELLPAESVALPAQFKLVKLSYTFADAPLAPRGTAGTSTSRRGEAIAREKSIMYLTVLGQNRQGVSWILCRSSVMTLKGNERRQSVQVSTT